MAKLRIYGSNVGIAQHSAGRPGSVSPFPAEELEHLFERRVRSDRTDGSGLGLYFGLSRPILLGRRMDHG
jgi:hypothetical protein